MCALTTRGEIRKIDIHIHTHVLAYIHQYARLAHSIYSPVPKTHRNQQRKQQQKYLIVNQSVRCQQLVRRRHDLLLSLRERDRHMMCERNRHYVYLAIMVPCQLIEEITSYGTKGLEGVGSISSREWTMTHDNICDIFHKASKYIIYDKR